MLVRGWRQRRRLTQRDLACNAGIPTRQLGALEIGRSIPNRELVLHLAEQLNIPLRERNALLGAAGFAPSFPVRAFDDPELAAARATVGLVLAGHEPNPAFAVDRQWYLMASNGAFQRLIAGVDPAVLSPPVNVLRLMLHPAGLASRIANLHQWREHVLQRLRWQFNTSGDAGLADLREEIVDYPVPRGNAHERADKVGDGVAIPLRLVAVDGTLSFLCTTSVFATPLDVTLAELTIETLFPADDATAAIMRRPVHAGVHEARPTATC
jgi:transcriptional regulator with XRE-family HTH domain